MTTIPLLSFEIQLFTFYTVNIIVSAIITMSCCTNRKV